MSRSCVKLVLDHHIKFHRKFLFPLLFIFFSSDMLFVSPPKGQAIIEERKKEIRAAKGMEFVNKKYYYLQD